MSSLWAAAGVFCGQVTIFVIQTLTLGSLHCRAALGMLINASIFNYFEFQASAEN
jgi:hypothetical protein